MSILGHFAAAISWIVHSYSCIAD